MKRTYQELTEDNEALARICHEAHLALRIGLNDSADDVHWDALPQDRKDLVIGEVRAFREGKTVSEVHQIWVDWMKERDWRPGERNLIQKTHPNLIPYKELPEEEQAKVRQACRIVFTHAIPYALEGIITRGLRDFPGADETVIKEDLPEVCVTHRHFYPCGAKDGDCVYSSEPREVDEVYRERYES